MKGIRFEERRTEAKGEEADSFLEDLDLIDFRDDLKYK